MSGVRIADGEGPWVSPPDGDGRAGRPPPGRRSPARTAAGLPDHGLPTADLPRVDSPDCWSAISAARYGWLGRSPGGPGVMRPGGDPPGWPAGHARFPQYRAAPSAAPAAAPAGSSTALARPDRVFRTDWPSHPRSPSLTSPASTTATPASAPSVTNGLPSPVGRPPGVRLKWIRIFLRAIGKVRP